MNRLAIRLASACLPVLATLGLASGALAAPVAGPTGEAFYTPPSPLPAGTNGDLIWYRSTTLNLGAGAPAIKAYTVLYRSTDSKGQPNAVTGTVMVPTATVSGARPIVSYAFGTQGLGPQCAPSKTLTVGPNYETANVIAALKRGWAVVGTDYAGYTSGSRPTYLAGKSEGNAVTDIVKAATQIPSVGLSYAAKTSIWGYSQGGQAAGFAGENKAAYAPSLNLAGVAAGGVPGDFFASARNLNGSSGASFLLGGVVGLANEFPAEIPFETLSNAAGKAARDDAYTKCVFALLNKYVNTDIKTFTEGGQTLDQLLAIPSVNSVIQSQALGTKAVSAPVYQYHGQADEFIPLAQAITLKKAWCAKGTKVQFDLYPSEHIVTQTQAATAATNWIAARIANQTVPSTCANTAAPPTSTADPAGGDFVFPLDNWDLKGSVKLGKLNQTLALPAGANFNGAANLTTKRITGSTSIPYMATSVKIAGINVRTNLIITDAEPVTGTIELDDNGDIHMRAQARVWINLKSFGVSIINFGANCRTQTPVTIALNFDGSVGKLGTGELTSAAESYFPELINCGLYGPVLSQLFSGNGNIFTLTEAPKAPKAY
ncbi:MAG: dienelactone hydrolase family protein [Solirubrobacteraceae bacterium]|nr:dienelactone hydrolase family protein [Solirubrobacteraceae bacterium]